MQYFAFRSTVSSNSNSNLATTVTYVIENASKCSFPFAYPGTTVMYTTNMEDTNSWKRALNTEYKEDEGHIVWTHHHDHHHHGCSSTVYFSYFPPYTYNQHLELVSKCEQHGTKVESLGQSSEGREIECISIGHGDRVCWIIHRQHPGEHQACYYAEGLLSRLLGLETNGEVDGLVPALLRQYTFYIVPNMNPDGGIRGHIRTNAVGSNLNREWADTAILSAPDDDGENRNTDNTNSSSNDGVQHRRIYKAPTMERSPEVYCVLNKMTETGVDCFLDIHGDEELPFVFFMSAQGGSRNWGPRLEALHGAFCAAYQRANSDAQTAVGYGKPPPEDVPGLESCANYAICNRFNCLTVTLEMPYKDCRTNPNPERGWSPHRSRMLGASLLDALTYVHPYLRTKGEFWKQLPEHDAYVETSPDYE